MANGLGAGMEAPNRPGSSQTDPRVEDDEFDRLNDTGEIGRNLEQYYVENGALKLCDGGKDLCLADGFESDWAETMTALEHQDVSAERVVGVFGLEEESLNSTLRDQDEAWVLYADDKPVGQWPSWIALLADLAAAELLENVDEDWNTRSAKVKGKILTGLRLFLNECPKDGGDIEFEQETVESCCQSHEVLAAVCSENGERVFEQPVDDLAA